MKRTSDALHPCVLRAGFFSSGPQGPHELRLVPRRCYDYELEYYTFSQGGVLVDGEYFEFSAGEIGVRKPGQVVCGVFPYNCHILCFSVDGNPKSSGDYGFGSPSEAEPNYQNPLLDALPGKILPDNPQHCENLFGKVSECAALPDDLSQFEANRLLGELLFVLFSQQWTAARAGYNAKILPAVAYIKENFSQDFSVQTLIDQSGLSKTHFHRCFKAYMQTTPAGLIFALRMDKARTLLHLTDSAVADIAAVCGYLDPVYFAHLFKQCTGMTPTGYRRATRGGFTPPRSPKES